MQKINTIKLTASINGEHMNKMINLLPKNFRFQESDQRVN